MSELKQCPFCQGEATLTHEILHAMSGRIQEYFVECTKCHSRSAMFSAQDYGIDGCKQRAIEAWNTRC